MSALGDAMGAIRSVLLMQASLERMEREVERLGLDLAGVRDVVGSVDRRVVRLEALVEAATMAANRGGQPPRIER